MLFCVSVCVGVYVTVCVFSMSLTQSRRVLPLFSLTLSCLCLYAYVRACVRACVCVCVCLAGRQCIRSIPRLASLSPLGVGVSAAGRVCGRV